jgi:hypothetical protein
VLSVRLGQQFIIENRIGAATNIGTEAGIKAPPDGYTLFLVTVSNAANATLYEKLSFDLVRAYTCCRLCLTYATTDTPCLVECRVKAIDRKVSEPSIAPSRSCMRFLPINH